MRTAGQEKYCPLAPNMMSWAMVGGVAFVSTSMTCPHDLVVESPEGTQAAEAEVHSRPSRHMASSSRLSPESMLPPRAAEAGGAFCASIVRFVADASTTLPASGVPVILMIVRVVPFARVVRYWSLPEVSVCAGRTVKRSARRGRLVSRTLAPGRPAITSAFSMTCVSTPK